MSKKNLPRGMCHSLDSLMTEYFDSPLSSFGVLVVNNAYLLFEIIGVGRFDPGSFQILIALVLPCRRLPTEK